jgi:hypothetical protein
MQVVSSRQLHVLIREKDLPGNLNPSVNNRNQLPTQALLTTHLSTHQYIIYVSFSTLPQDKGDWA